jgi:hypothetical protein
MSRAVESASSMPGSKRSDPPLLRRWVRATFGGWVLGVPTIAALALLGEVVGIGGSQALVGAGMGAAIGFMQARALRIVLPATAPWFWASLVGLSLPFLATDIAKLTGWSSAYSLYACVALGGCFVGVWQAFILRQRVHGAQWWAVASALGWTLAGGMAAVADGLTRGQQFRGLGGALAYLGLVASGGLVLGMITGVALTRMLRNEASPA